MVSLHRTEEEEGIFAAHIRALSVDKYKYPNLHISPVSLIQFGTLQNDRPLRRAMCNGLCNGAALHQHDSRNDNMAHNETEVIFIERV